MATKKEQANSQQRVTDFIIFIGQNGTGKTTLAKRMIKALSNRRVLILQSSPLEQSWDEFSEIDLKAPELKTFTGTKRTYYETYERETWELLFKNFHNGVLVMDDCRNYIDSQVNIEPYLKKLFTNRRQKMMDMIAIVHAFDEIPPRFFPFYTKMFLFFSKIDPIQFKRNIPDIDRVRAVWNRVCQTSRTNKYYWEMVIP